MSAVKKESAKDDPKEASVVREPKQMPDRMLEKCAEQHATFPVRLHRMLDDLELEGLSHIVSWQPHGRCFLVHDQERFVKDLLPLYFKSTRYTSFQRQLNMYSFKRITAGRDKGAYYHPMFLRGDRLLCMQIPRTKVKGQGPRKASSPDEEPNFYLQPFRPLSNPVRPGVEARDHASAAGLASLDLARLPMSQVLAFSSGVPTRNLLDPTVAAIPPRASMGLPQQSLPNLLSPGQLAYQAPLLRPQLQNEELLRLAQRSGLASATPLPNHTADANPPALSHAALIAYLLAGNKL